MTVANLFARIGIKADTDKAKEFSGAMKNVVGDLKAAALGALGFSAGIAGALKMALNTAKVYRDFQNESGASTDELQKWQAVAAGANVSTDALAESVKSLAQNREKIKLGTGNMSGFAFLGINPNDDPFKILDQLRTKTAGLPQAMKSNLLAQMGVSSQFLQILNLTNAEFDKMRGGAFIIPPSAFNAMNQLQGSLNTLTKMGQWFTSLLAERLAPVIDKVVKQVIQWVTANKNGLIDGLVKGTQFIFKFIGAIVNVATWISHIVEKTVGWKNALIAFGVVWAVFNRGLLASPITWLIGGLLLLIAVMDDLHAALGIDGDKRKSFFGSLFANNPQMKKMFQDMFGVFKDIGTAISSLFNGDMKGFDETMKKWGLFGQIISSLKTAVEGTVMVLQDLFNMDFKKAGEDLVNLNGAMGEGISISEFIKNKNANPKFRLLDKNATPEEIARNELALKNSKASGQVTTINTNNNSFTWNQVNPSTPKEQQEQANAMKQMLKDIDSQRKK